MSDLLNLADRVGWQPIETAPRDRETFDVWVPDEDGGYRVPDLYYSQRGTLMRGGGPADFLPRWPTHWMPLPSPPAASLRAIHARGCADGEEGK